MIVLVEVHAKPDVNGNGRRGWIVTKDDGEVAFIQEDGLGTYALSDLFLGGHQHVFAASLEVSPGTYKRLCRGDFE